MSPPVANTWPSWTRWKNPSWRVASRKRCSFNYIQTRIRKQKYKTLDLPSSSANFSGDLITSTSFFSLAGESSTGGESSPSVNFSVMVSRIGFGGKSPFSLSDGVSDSQSEMTGVVIVSFVRSSSFKILSNEISSSKISVNPIR